MYFDHIAVHGRRHIPHGVPAIFASNHPSGLLDPMVLMASLPDRHITGIAKHSLFGVPGVGHVLRTMQAVPAAKPHDEGLKAQISAEERRYGRVHSALIAATRTP